MTDLADIRSQEAAKRAVEIAAAGNHPLLLIGPTGCGKTMLAEAAKDLFPLGGARIFDDLDLRGEQITFRDSVDTGLPTIATTDNPSALSAGVLDRCAVTVVMHRVSAADMLLPPPSESTAAVRARIEKARSVTVTGPNADALKIVREIAEGLNLTARGYRDVLAVAATIARLDGLNYVKRLHVAEAASYRYRPEVVE